MPDLNDLVVLADSLGTDKVLAAEPRCAAVRNRNSSCSRCVDICPTDAITVEKNHLRVSASACVGCGACTTVCPLEALVPIEPSDYQLENAVEQQLQNTPGRVCFACARMAAREEADPQGYVEVPCLARVDESLLLSLIARGITDIRFVDGTCETCKLNVCGPLVQMVVSTANDLLAAAGSDVRVVRGSAFPEDLLGYVSEKTYGDERRAFFTDTGNSMKGLLGKAADFFVKNESQKNSMAAAVFGSFGLLKDGKLSLPDPQRHNRLLDALWVISEEGRAVPSAEEGALPDDGTAQSGRAGLSAKGQAVTRYFGTFSYEPGKCRKCGICSRVCPTGALHQSRTKVDGMSRITLEYSSSDCVQCHLCEDICFRKCIQVLPMADLHTLFDFEPQVFLSRAPVSANAHTIDGASAPGRHGRATS